MYCMTDKIALLKKELVDIKRTEDLDAITLDIEKFMSIDGSFAKKHQDRKTTKNINSRIMQYTTKQLNKSSFSR